MKDGITIHWIPRITFSFITWQGADVKRVQFPARLCFAVIVHRNQGQTLNRVVYHLYAGVFSCKDAYMSAYRVRKSADVSMLTGDRICPYTLCASCQRCLLSFKSRVVALALLWLYVSYCCLSCYIFVRVPSWRRLFLLAFGGYCSLLRSFSFHFQLL